MSFWKNFLHWIARRELAEERDRLRRYANWLGYEFKRAGVPQSLIDAIDQACREALPAGIGWSIRQQDNAELSIGTVSIIVEQSPLASKRAS